jgi:hypothetical protein
VFNRLSKLLAQYHIVLPKRFLEGDKGVEVFEVRQFGHKMGMTDSGEFVNEVPSTHYLFLQYGILSSLGVTYAKPVVGGMFRVTARLVDKDELDKLLDMAEITMSEEAEVRQMAAKAMAPKEPMHDITSDEKKKGNKEAVATSEKGLDEGRMPASVIRHKQKLANMTPEEKAKKFAGKSEEQLKSMARRHGYGKDSTEYSKTVKEDKGPCWKGYEMVGMKKKGGKPVPNCVPVKEEEQIDELSKKALGSYVKRASVDLYGKGAARGFEVSKGQMDSPAKKKAGNRITGIYRASDKLAKEETQIDEKAPPGAKFERMVKHIKKGYSKDGLSAKEKGIAYATAWKAKNREKGE